MPTLNDVQQEVNKALEKIRDGDLGDVKTVLWPKIKSMIPQCTDLNEIDPMDMGRLVYKRLNEQSLHAAPTPINLVSLKSALEARTVQVPEPAALFKWLPW